MRERRSRVPHLGTAGPFRIGPSPSPPTSGCSQHHPFLFRAQKRRRCPLWATLPFLVLQTELMALLSPALCGGGKSRTVFVRDSGHNFHARTPCKSRGSFVPPTRGICSGILPGHPSDAFGSCKSSIALCLFGLTFSHRPLTHTRVQTGTPPLPASFGCSHA